MLAVMSDAEAVQIVQPLPVKRTLFTVSSGLTFKNTRI
jgi:hypothetical protein